MAEISYIERLARWFEKFKRYKVTYKEGFFHLSNLANSPHLIIESFDKMPFCKHDREERLLTANTMFLGAKLNYCEPEEGLFVFVSELNYKKNILMTNIYDKSLPMDYHFLNLHYKKKSFKSKSMMINGMVLTDKTWTVFKAGNAISDYHFKDSDEFNITIYFTSEWFYKQVDTKNYFTNSDLLRFFKSDNTYLFLSDEEAISDKFYDDFASLTKQNKDDSKNEEMKELVSVFFEHFIRNLNKESFHDNHFKLSDKDRKYVQKAEKYLLDNLFVSFPGIETLSQVVGVSATKLKNDFKVIHNKSIYQYYRNHQMNLAYTLLQKKEHGIKEIANLLGYDNPSKFTAAFKEQYGILPSEIL